MCQGFTLLLLLLLVYKKPKLSTILKTVNTSYYFFLYQPNINAKKLISRTV